MSQTIGAGGPSCKAERPSVHYRPSIRAGRVEMAIANVAYSHLLDILSAYGALSALLKRHWFDGEHRSGSLELVSFDLLVPGGSPLVLGPFCADCLAVVERMLPRWCALYNASAVRAYWPGLGAAVGLSLADPWPGGPIPYELVERVVGYDVAEQPTDAPGSVGWAVPR